VVPVHARRDDAAVLGRKALYRGTLGGVETTIVHIDRSRADPIALDPGDKR
jgi:hypothetical protein